MIQNDENARHGDTHVVALSVGMLMGPSPPGDALILFVWIECVWQASGWVHGTDIYYKLGIHPKLED